MQLHKHFQQRSRSKILELLFFFKLYFLYICSFLIVSLFNHDTICKCFKLRNLWVSTEMQQENDAVMIVIYWLQRIHPEPKRLSLFYYLSETVYILFSFFKFNIQPVNVIIINFKHCTSANV